MIPDPTNLQSHNRYSYVNNNPLKYVDPSGHIEIGYGPSPYGGDLGGNLDGQDVFGTVVELFFGITTSVHNTPTQASGEITYVDENGVAHLAEIRVTPGGILSYVAPLDDDSSDDEPTFSDPYSPYFKNDPIIQSILEGNVGIGGIASVGRGALRTLINIELKNLPRALVNAFEGSPILKTFKAGQRIYRSPWLPEESVANPGRWFGTRKAITQSGADSLYNITKWGNPNAMMRTYEFTSDMTVYYGKVKGGTGYQLLFPKNMRPGDFLKFIDEGILK